MPSLDQRRWLVITSTDSVLQKVLRTTSGLPLTVVTSPEAVALVDKPWSLTKFLDKLSAHLSASDAPASAWDLVVDMQWVLKSAAATANVTVWGEALQRMGSLGLRSVLSVYHREQIPERVLMAGLHAHPFLVVCEGPLTNPHYLPYPLTGLSPERTKLDYWLGALSPSLTFIPASSDAAMGAASRFRSVTNTKEIEEPSDEALANERWKVRCLGEFKVYRQDGQRIDWSGAGAASRRIRTLFAYLLLCGQRGASKYELCALLWPNANTTQLATNRLHHTVNGLRKALIPETSGTKVKHHPFLTRHDQRYILNTPANTWVDVEDFEQLCRQGVSLMTKGAMDEALLCLESALQLYSGDLFADLPKEFTETSDPDWCRSQRYWFREMYFKVHRDCAQIHREMGRYLEAIQHCHLALQRDPTCQLAHCELMKIYAQQGRQETLERQYRLFKLAATEAGTNEANDAVHTLYVKLMRGLNH